MQRMRVSTGRRALDGRRRRPTGFTLIELLVVIVILGILMAVAVPTFLSQQAKAQDSRTQQYLTTAFKAIRAGTPDTNNQYPSSTSMVSWIQQSEPELTAERGDCLTGVTSAPVDAVLVDPSSTTNSLQLCARSQSGNVWKLTASATGVQQLLDGTLIPLAVSGNEITDATRAAGVQGDGLSNDSSTGIWEGTTNIWPHGGAEESGVFYGIQGSSTAITRDTTTAKFGSASVKVVTPGITSSEGCDFGSAYVPAVTGGSIYTASAWVSAPAGQGMKFFLRGLDGSETTVGQTTTSFTGTGNWQHVAVTRTMESNAAYADILLVTSGTAAITFWIDGVQIEQKPIATPYVETNGATATRAAAGVQAPASFVNATQEWFAVRLRFGFPGGDASGHRFVSWRNADSSGGIELYYHPTEMAGSPALWMSDVIGSAKKTAAGIAYGSTHAIGETHTLIGYVTPTTVALSLDGAPFVQTTGRSSAGIPMITAATFYIGRYAAAATQWADSDVFWFVCGTGTLSDADAATINSWGNTDPKQSSFPSAAQATMAWNGVGNTGSLK